MPEYMQLQTYATCNENNFTALVEQFRKVLEQWTVSDQRVLSWLAEIQWPTSEDDGFGDVFASSFKLFSDSTPIECAGIDVSLYTSSALLSADELPAWVGFNLLFDIRMLRERGIAPYKKAVGTQIWKMLNELALAFPELGAYLTDSYQDNRSWRALSEGIGDPWFFDLAIFPRRLAEQFSVVPPGFQGVVVEQGFAFAQENRWQVLPWLDV